MNHKIFKKMENGNFYIFALLISLFLFYFLQIVVMNIGIFAIDYRIPGFGSQFASEVATSNISEYSNLTMAVLNISQFVGEIILGGILVAFIGKELVKDFKRFKKDLGVNIFYIILGFTILTFISFILTVIYEELGITGTSDNQAAIETALNANTGIFMLLAVLLLAPFVEEIIFRKFLYGVIEEKFKLLPIVSVLLSAFIFAVIHAHDVFFFQYLAMALVLCGSYSLSKNNIFIPMGIHFLNNSTVLAYLVITVLF